MKSKKYIVVLAFLSGCALSIFLWFHKDGFSDNDFKYIRIISAVLDFCFFVFVIRTKRIGRSIKVILFLTPIGLIAVGELCFFIPSGPGVAGPITVFVLIFFILIGTIILSLKESIRQSRFNNPEIKDAKLKSEDK
jgi:hypothetical protein